MTVNRSKVDCLAAIVGFVLINGHTFGTCHAQISEAEYRSDLMSVRNGAVCSAGFEDAGHNDIIGDAQSGDGVHDDTVNTATAELSEVSSEQKPARPKSESSVSYAYIPCPETEKSLRVVSGKRRVSDLKENLVSFRTKIRRLCNERHKANKNLKGSVCMYFVIEQSGIVSQAAILRSSLKDAMIEDEMLKGIQKIRFEKCMKNREPTVVTYLISFHPLTTFSSAKAIIKIAVLIMGMTSVLITVGRMGKT